MLARLIVALFLTLSFSAPAQDFQSKTWNDIVPLVFKSDTLAYLSQGPNEYPVLVRARQVSQRMEEVVDGFNMGVDSLYLELDAQTAKVMYNDELVMLITEQDASANHLSAEALAKIQLDYLKERISANQEVSLSTKEWLIRIGYFLASLVVLIIVLRIILWLFRKLNAYLSKFERSFLKHRKNLLKYFIPKTTANIFVFISNVLKFLIIVLLLLAYLPFMFSFFPFSQDFVAKFYSYVEAPVRFVINGVINFIPNLIFILVIIGITRYVNRVLRDIADDIEDRKLVLKGFPVDWARMTQKIFSLFIYAFALVLIYPHLPGSASPAFKGISIFLGALLSFGSTSAVANIVAGVVITYMRAFQIGDRVQIQNTVGDVMEKTLLVTRIRTTKNEDVTIPNANIINNHMVNYTANTRREGLVLNTTVTIGYDIPWKKVEQLLISAAEKSLNVEKEPKPFVLKKSLDDFYVAYEINAFTKNAKQIPRSYSSLHENILDEFNKAGIEILSPSYIAARDGNLTTIPDELEDNARSPFERIVDHLTGRNQKVKVSKPEDTDNPSKT
jgi:small-conductance mechanosensitive channel